jgi:chromosome segregation ATPase
VADAVSNVVTERMTDLAQTLHNLGQGLSADLSGRLHAVGEQSAGLRALVTELRSAGRQDADALKAQLAELSNRLPKAVDEAAIAAQLRSQEERLVAWLERLNVAAERETRRADEQHDEVKNLLGTLARDQAMVSQVRSQLNRVRGNLSAGLADVKEEMLRSFLARSFLSTRLETALEPAQAALTELDAVLKRLAEL